MNDQINHLKSLEEQEKNTLGEINQLEKALEARKELLFKIKGAIEYLTQIGVKIQSENDENQENVSKQPKNAKT